MRQINYRKLQKKDICKFVKMRIDQLQEKEYGCETIHITASDMGVSLYTDYGFEKNNNFMQLNIN